VKACRRRKQTLSQHFVLSLGCATCPSSLVVVVVVYSVEHRPTCATTPLWGLNSGTRAAHTSTMVYGCSFLWLRHGSCCATCTTGSQVAAACLLCMLQLHAVCWQGGALQPTDCHILPAVCCYAVQVRPHASRPTDHPRIPQEPGCLCYWQYPPECCATAGWARQRLGSSQGSSRVRASTQAWWLCPCPPLAPPELPVGVAAAIASW
jgi:hypothetical protein